MANHRFYIDPDSWSEESPVLTGDEAHHCREVLRGKAGERLVVFNGRGIEADVEIESIDQRKIALRVRTVTKTDRPPATLILGQAVPKGKNMDLIIQKATELGASGIVPLLSQRTVVRLEGNEAGKKQEKWQRIAIEACKQCGQNWLPEVFAPISIDDWINRIGPAADNEWRLAAALSPESESLKTVFAERDPANPPESATILIGPEGDFTPAELSNASNAGFRFVSLGPIVLRSETAAIYALSVLGHELM